MTVKQKQCLLYYLGYYAGEIDGDWGTRSETAAKSFQKDHGLQADGIFGDATAKAARAAVANGCFKTAQLPDTGSGKTRTFWDGIKFFTREEFRCKCGGKYCNGFPAEPQEAMVRIADAARHYFGRPGHVVSGLRCKNWNAIQGGVENSQHLYGEAVDLRIDGITADQLMTFIKTQPHRYVYKINGTNVHVDIPKGKR